MSLTLENFDDKDDVSLFPLLQLPYYHCEKDYYSLGGVTLYRFFFPNNKELFVNYADYTNGTWELYDYKLIINNKIVSVGVNTPEGIRTTAENFVKFYTL